MRTLGRFADGVLEAGWLATVALVPLVIDKDSAQAFESAKAGVLQAISVLVLVAWLTKRLVLPASSAVDVAMPARLLALLRRPLVLPVAVFFFSSLVATVVSLSPAESLWGHRGRAQGLATLLAELSIFAATANNLRADAQLRRLVTSLLLPSIPIALYALCQRSELEPLLLSTDTEVQRATSLFGQPVYLGAYLAMVCPFVVLRTLEAACDATRTRARRTVVASAYGLVFVLQLLALLCTESRGPLVGLAVAGALGLLAYAARRGLRRGVLLLWVCAGVATTLVALGAPTWFKQVPTDASSARVVTRAAETFAVSGGGGQFRSTTWKVAARVLANKTPLELADGSHDGHPGLRSWVGYGPELQYAIAPPFYDSELPTLFGYFLIDRFHNQLWDTLLTTGLFGLAAWLALETVVFMLVLRTLGVLASTAQRRLFFFAYAGCALASAAGWTVLRGLPFCFLGLQIGAAVGVAVFLSLVAWSVPQSASAGPDARAVSVPEGVSIAALAALAGHLIEVSFSFVTLSTGALFWIVSALAVACARASSDAAAPRAEATPRQLSAASEALRDAAVLGWPLLTLGFVFLGASSQPLRVGVVLWDGLTLLARPQGARAPVVLGLMLATWLGGMLLLRLDRPAGSNPHVGRILGVAAVAALVYWVQQASTLAERARSPIGTVADVTKSLASRSSSTTTFYVSCLLLLVLFALASTRVEGRIPHNERPLAWWRAALPALCLVLGLLVIERISLRPAHAEAAIALGEALKAHNRFPLAEHALVHAITLMPADDVYRATLAKAYGKHARVDAAHAAVWLERAEQTLREAIALNPAASENATNLAVFGGQRAQQGGTVLRPVVSELYTRALRLHPLDPNLWRMWGSVQLGLLGDPHGALRSVQTALPLDPKSAAAYGLLAECQLALSRALGGEARTQSLRGAADAYEKAVALAPDQAGYRVNGGKTYLALGQASKAASWFRVALTRLPPASRERQVTLSLLRRAESETSLIAVPPVPP